MADATSPDSSPLAALKPLRLPLTPFQLHADVRLRLLVLVASLSRGRAGCFATIVTLAFMARVKLPTARQALADLLASGDVIETDSGLRVRPVRPGEKWVRLRADAIEAIIRSRDISVYAIVCHLRDVDPGAAVTRSRIRALLALKDEHLASSLKRLADLGLVSIDQGRRGRGHATTYTVYQRPVALSTKPPAQVRPEAPETPRMGARKPPVQVSGKPPVRVRPEVPYRNTRAWEGGDRTPLHANLAAAPTHQHHTGESAMEEEKIIIDNRPPAMADPSRTASLIAGLRQQHHWRQRPTWASR